MNAAKNKIFFNHVGLLELKQYVNVLVDTNVMKQHTASIFRANFGYVSTLQSIVWM
jgi:hypothetical protein